MKAFVRRSFEIVCYIGYFATIVISVLASVAQTQIVAIGTQLPEGVALALLFLGGLISGFLLATFLFGGLFLLIEIAESTRATRDLIENRT